MNFCKGTEKLWQYINSLKDCIFAAGKKDPDSLRELGEPGSAAQKTFLEDDAEPPESIEDYDLLNVEHPVFEKTLDLEQESVSDLNSAVIENGQEETNEEKPVAEAVPANGNDVADSVSPSGKSSVESKREESLLDNRPLVKLAENVVRLGDDIARHLPTLSAEAAEFAQYVSGRLDEMLLRCGLEPIEDETEFHIVRHQAVPPGNIPNGTPITATLVPGLRLEEKVLRRAKVAVECNLNTNKIKERKNEY